MQNSSRSRLRRIQALQRGQCLAAPEVPPLADEPVSTASASPFTPAESGSVRVRMELASGETRTLQVSSPVLLFGRDSRCHVRLPDSAAAGKQMLAVRVDDRFFVLNLADSDAKPALGASRGRWIPAGNPLRIGQAQVTLDRPEQATEARPVREWTAPELWLRFPHGDGAQRYQMREPVNLFGRDPRCRVRIPSSSVSRFHCVLVQSSDGVWISDLASREGVRVNGRLVEHARIDDDCELTIGRKTLFLHRGSEPPVDAPGSEILSSLPVTAEQLDSWLADLRAMHRESLQEVRLLVESLAAAVQAGTTPDAAVLNSALQRLDHRLAHLG